MDGVAAKPRAVGTKRLLALGISLILSFSAICAVVLWEMGEKDYQHTKQAATNLVASIASEIARNLELYDLSLQAVVDGVKLPEINAIRPELRQVVLFDRAATAKDLGAILVLDPAGEVILDSRTITPRKANFSDRDFFVVHQKRDDAGLFISKPWINETGAYLVSLSRRISKTDGSFGGVVVGSMRLSYFHDLFRKLSFGRGDSMTLFRTDGTILMRAPFDVDQVGQSISRSQVFKYFPAQQSGFYVTTSILDQVRRLFVFQQVGSYPLLIANGLSLEGIYADWRKQVWSIGLLLATLCVFTIVLLFYLIATLKRRAAAETQLAQLANTDGLTGLPNRRRLDEVLHSEWQRSLRTGEPIALLMIDVDHFKTYNDLHGHQAGDAALATIGACIAQNAQRASDLAARYGGDEFALLLPGQGTQGAREVAERVRSSLTSIRNAEDKPCPTVSIGLVSTTVAALGSPAELIRLADAALYAAKRDGRDRVIVSPASDVPRNRRAA
jgi:diguanylate cyclase (GGDEF)-like protein